MSYGTDQIVKLGGNMQTLMAGLLRGIVISDLRIMQYRVRADEYLRLRRHIDFAARHGVLTPILSNAVFLLEEDIAPYAKSGWFEGPVRSAPDVLTELIDGLLEMLEGFENRKGELNQDLNPEQLTEMNKKLVKTKNAVRNLTKQRDDMLDVIQANMISPKQFLLLSNDFQKRFIGCSAYNKSMINVITREFAVTDDYLSLFQNITAYFVFLFYSRPYATDINNNLPLQAFKNEPVTLMDGKKLKAVYLEVDIDGQFYNTMNRLNQESYDRQVERHLALKKLHRDLYIRYIGDLIKQNRKWIAAFYTSPQDSAVLLKKASAKLRDICMNTLTKYVETRLRNIIKQNEENLALLTSHGTSDEYLLKSPINVMLGEMVHNGIWFTNIMRAIKNTFVPNMKRAMMIDRELQWIMMTPSMKRQRIRKNEARRREQETELALEETAAMDVEEDTASGLAATMDMEFDEGRDMFQGTRTEYEILRIIKGQYILTERSFLKYQVDFPVIQIEKMMTGNRIIGVNEAAFRDGFRTNWFIKSIEEADSKQTDEFLKESGASAAGSQPKTTIFRMVALGQKMQDRDEQEKELLEEALDDNTDMFGDDFFKDLN